MSECKYIVRTVRIKHNETSVFNVGFILHDKNVKCCSQESCLVATGSCVCLDPNLTPEPFLPCLCQTVTVEAVHEFFEELRARKRRRTNAGYQ